MMISALVAIVVFGVVAAVLNWLRFRFRVSGDQVLVRSGVFKREELSVEFDRIQNVSIREPFYMRPFGLALLSIDTAGSGKKETTLSGIPKKLASDLRNKMLVDTVGEASEVAGHEQAGSGDPVLLSRTSREIVIYGLTANFIIWLAIAVGAFFGAFDLHEELGTWLVGHFDPAWAEMIIREGLGLSVFVVTVISVLLLVFVGLPLISILGALYRHHGYQLRVKGETYRKSSGLLSRFDESLKRHKIQAMVLKQNFVAGFFKRTNMQLRVASAGSCAGNGQLSALSKATFQVPVLSKSELPVFVNEFFPQCDFEKVQFTRINRRRLGMVVLGWGVMPPLVVVTTILSLVVNGMFALMLPLVLVAAWLIVNQVWTRIGFGVVGEYGFIRKGFFGTQTTVFPMFKVQRVDISQTPGQRRKRLAQLSIHLASHTLTVPYVPEDDAKRFRDLTLFHMESSKMAWY